MEYSELNIKLPEETKEVEFNGKVIQVKQFLPTEKKNSLVQLALQQSEEDNILYNPILLDVYTNVYIIFFYTDLEFKDVDKTDPLEIVNLFDEMFTSGLIETVIGAIPENEYNDLIYYRNAYKEANETQKTTASYVIDNFLSQLPAQLEQLSTTIENFDPNQFNEVIEFARAANGGRDIPKDEEYLPQD